MRPIADDVVANEGARDYYKAQQNELDQLKTTGNYGMGSYLADSPWVVMSKLKGWDSTGKTDHVGINGSIYSPNDAMADQMDKMRQISLKQYQSPKAALSDDEKRTTKEWQDLKQGRVWMHVPNK